MAAGRLPGEDGTLRAIQDLLGFEGEPDVRYQLLHRTASAVSETKRFKARSAVMLVRSFIQEKRWFDDFAAFMRLFGVSPEADDRLCRVRDVGGVRLFCGDALFSLPK